MYEHITSNEKHFLTKLNNNLPTSGISYTRIKIGSVILIAKCETLEALNDFERIYKSKELNRRLNDIFVSCELLDELDVKSLELKTTVKDQNLAACRNYLLTEDMVGKKRGLKEASGKRIVWHFSLYAFIPHLAWYTDYSNNSVPGDIFC